MKSSQLAPNDIAEYRHRGASYYAACRILFVYVNVFRIKSKCLKNLRTSLVFDHTYTNLAQFIRFKIWPCHNTRLYGTWNEPPHDKINKMTVRPAKTQMPRLIWVFAGRTATLLVLSCCGSNCSFAWHHKTIHKLSLVTRKPVFRVCDHVRLKAACAATEAS